MADRGERPFEASVWAPGGDPESVEGIEDMRTSASDDVGRHPHDVSDHAEGAVVVDGSGDRLVRLVVGQVVPDDPDAHVRR